jgi:hypothetical protein
MEQDEAEKFIRANCKLTVQHVIVAKAYLINAPLTTNPLELIDGFLRHQGVEQIDKSILNGDADLEPQLKRVTEYLTWLSAANEAIWQLVHSGYLVINGGGFHEKRPNIGWTQRGYSSGIRFDDFGVVLPQLRASRITPRTFLSDADLFLQDLAIPKMHADVADSLGESIRCFRYELYLAAVVLLGKAAEGTWTDMGLRVAKLFGLTKLEADVSSGANSFSKKIRLVSDSVRSNAKEIENRSGVRLEDFQSSALWVDIVRDSRNAVHHLGAPATANTYEKVATLIIGSVAPLRTLHKIINAP